MRDVYRGLVDHVGTNDALVLAQQLEHWHDSMVAHRASIGRLGFPPDGHPEWANCPHVEARRLWDRAVRVLGRRAWGTRVPARARVRAVPLTGVTLRRLAEPGVARRDAEDRSIRLHN